MEITIKKKISRKQIEMCDCEFCQDGIVVKRDRGAGGVHTEDIFCRMDECPYYPDLDLNIPEAYWMPMTRTGWRKCSKCKTGIPHIVGRCVMPGWNYCPKCGAEMEREENDDESDSN